MEKTFLMDIVAYAMQANARPFDLAFFLRDSFGFGVEIGDMLKSFHQCSSYRSSFF
jgi:hypothetical protein